MKIQPIYFVIFLATASAYIVETPGSHESPLKLGDQKQTNKVVPSPDDLKTVASQGMLGGTSDLMKRLSLGSDYAVATSHLEEAEVPAVAEVEQDSEVDIMALLESIKQLEEEMKEIISKEEMESLQEQIKPTKTMAVTEAMDEAPEVKVAEMEAKMNVKLTIVEDEEEEADVPELEVEAGEDIVRIAMECDEAEEENISPTNLEAEEVAPTMVGGAEESVQKSIEEPLPYSSYSREQMEVFSAVDDFSAKFDEKLPRRLVSNFRLDQDGRRVNSMRPAFVARAEDPNTQATDEAPSATGHESFDIGESAIQHSPPPTTWRVGGYLPEEYSCDNWFDTKSKVTAAVYGKKEKTRALSNASTQAASITAVSQPASNWFDNQSKVTEAIYGNPKKTENDFSDPALQERNRNAVTGKIAYFSNRYSYDNWHDNPTSNNLFMREGHIE
ncbi:unnamed protein product [Cylindrotheca closterium]|uniref:Uncharacterized protein n=1 Tax=Cylindrotheca closterium TaxID=2856 RepID=A0AAD2JJV1_9STRA|nr:unnamed protein product [Cylindrotheca closterium]